MLQSWTTQELNESTTKYYFFSHIAVLVEAKEIVGWVEKAAVTRDNVILKAKIDTGARNSSLHCGCITTTQENGEKKIRLKLTTYKGETLELEKKVIRRAKVKRHDGKMQIRDVIKLDICLGSVRKEVEVNLIDRTGLNYQLLIGRSFLDGDFLVDPGKQFLNSPKCDL